MKLNDKVFVKSLRVKGVIKEVKNNKYKVTFFDEEGKRKFDWFEASQLARPKKKIDNFYYRLVYQFHKAFGHLVSEKPQVLDREYALNRASWVLEEMIELLHATSKDKVDFTDLYDQLVVRGYQTYLKHVNKEIPQDVLAAQVDAFTDASYFIHGGFVNMGVEPDKVFSAVHKANMDKIFPDGKPHYNDQGKVIKPEGWKAPDEAIRKELDRQLSQSK